MQTLHMQMSVKTNTHANEEVTGNKRDYYRMKEGKLWPYKENSVENRDRIRSDVKYPSWLTKNIWSEVGLRTK